MSWLSKITDYFKGRGSATGTSDAQIAYRLEDDQHLVSRFGGITDRTNREHWALARNESINNDISQKLPALQARGAFEYGHNPDFEGVCNTFKDDVVGRNGPMLQVISDSEEFNTAVEQGFREAFEDPDPSHRYGGVEDMKTWVHGLLLAGSYYNVSTNTKRRGTRMTFGWRSVHARRFVTPADKSGDPQVAFGCKYSESTGEPVEYYIQKPIKTGGIQFNTGAYDTVPAEAVQHCFIPVEAEQLTGYPMMASTYAAAADIRDLEKFVLESMKNAHANSPYLQAMDPTKVVDPDPIPEGKLRFEPGEAGVAPFGYAWANGPQVQPIGNFLDLKREKASELGRPIHMPLLVVLLTAGEANFSSAQYEGTVYTDGVASVQGFIERRSLIPIVRHGIIPEVVFRKRVRVPKTFELVFTWNVPAHANIEKFVKAIRVMVEDGLISQAQGSALLGYDWEKVVASRKKVKRALEDAELPAAPTNAGSGQSVSQDEAEDEQEDEEKPSSNQGRVSASRFSIA